MFRLCPPGRGEPAREMPGRRSTKLAKLSACARSMSGCSSSERLSSTLSARTSWAGKVKTVGGAAVSAWVWEETAGRSKAARARGLGRDMRETA